MQLHIAAKSSVLCCHLAYTENDNDSTFSQIILVLAIKWHLFMRNVTES